MTLLTRRSLLIAAVAAPVLGATAARAATHAVAIQGHAFAPQTLTVRRGDTVTFTNNDRAPHTATQQPNGFDTRRLNQGASAEIVFDRAGRFEYICEFHPSMRGTIIVQ